MIRRQAVLLKQVNTRFHMLLCQFYWSAYTDRQGLHGDSLSRVIKESNSDVSGDYAVVQEAMGNICLSIGDVLQATTHFKNALAIYEVLFDAEPELIEEKKQDILETYTQAGVQLGRQWLDAKN